MFTQKDTNCCKGIAVTMLLFHHLFNDLEEYTGYTVNYWPLTGERITFLALLCKVCVAIFVFLSGYGISISYERYFSEQTGNREDKEGIFTFVWKRYWKLMCMYWFIFFLTLLCQPLGRTVTEAYGSSLKEKVMGLVVDFFGLSYLVGMPSLNPSWWYYSLAVVIIFLMPVIITLIRKYGTLTTITAVTGLIFFFRCNNPSSFYIFSLILGSGCYYSGFFEKLNNGIRRKKKNYFLYLLLSVVGILCFLSMRTNYNFNGIADGFLTLSIVVFVHLLIGKIPVVSGICAYIGKHSGNIYLIHNQLYSFYFLGFFYSFGHWAVIVCVLLLICLFLSVLIEKIKELTNYNLYMEKLGNLLLKGFLS